MTDAEATGAAAFLVLVLFILWITAFVILVMT